MDAIVVGIDVSKDRLDVHVLPSQEAFHVPRDGAGIADLCARLAPLAPGGIALEATGGFETVVAAGLAAAGLPRRGDQPGPGAGLRPGAGPTHQD